MKNAFSIFLVLALVFMAVACGSQPSNLEKDVNIPSFVANPPVSNDYIFGVGSARLNNTSLSLQAADARARTDIATKLNTEVQAMIIDYARTAGTENNQTAALLFYESISRQLTDARLTGLEVVERVRTNDGTYWTLMRISKKDAAQIAADLIESEASQYAEFKAMEALRMMEQQLRGR
jgi:hypothetical protein